MANAGDYRPIRSKYKAINALLPYAALQEHDGKPEMLDAFLCAFRASKMLEFRWLYSRNHTGTLFSKASPHGIILVSPHINWGSLEDGGDLVQQWAAVTSAVPYTEELAQSIVDTLLQIAYYNQLLPHIPTNIWLWLNKQPSLHPTSSGRYYGTQLPVVKAIRELKDIKIIKSYFLLVWSEWDYLTDDAFNESCISICEDFSEAWSGWHWTELIQHLDHILTQLGQGLEHLQQHNPNLTGDNFQKMEDQYRKLKDILVEAVTGVSYSMITLPRMLTQVDMYRISCNIHVCTPTPMSIALYLEPSALPTPSPSLVTWTLMHLFIEHPATPSISLPSNRVCPVHPVLLSKHHQGQFLYYVSILDLLSCMFPDLYFCL